MGGGGGGGRGSSPPAPLVSTGLKGIWFSLFAIDVFRKCACVVPLKDKKGVAVTNAFQNIDGSERHKPKKVLVDKGNEFYNSSIKS